VLWVASDTRLAQSMRRACACFVLFTACSVYDSKLADSRSTDAGDAGVTRSQRERARADAQRTGSDVGVGVGEFVDASVVGADASATGAPSECPISCSAPNATTQCEAGHCVVATCLEGYADCDSRVGNGCETAVNDPLHCGACDRVCSLSHASAVCSNGECKVETCEPGFADCDGDGTSCETALDTLTDCGACGVKCAQASCVGGVCSSADCRQRPGMADCDHDGASCETDLRSSVEHCGRCGNACAFDPDLLPRAAISCRDGVCSPVCETGWGDCDLSFRNGCETSLDTPADCGSCGHACAIAGATEVCRAQRCEVLRCDPDRADCDGDGESCETRLDTVDHCGSCDFGCDLPHADSACRGAVDARACALVSCQTDWADCDFVVANGCEHDARSVSEGGLGPCLPDNTCTRADYGDHVYFICSRRKTWDGARDTCRTQLGGDLVVLDSPGESDFLRGYASTRHWVGHTDRARRGVWTFATTGIAFWQAGLFLLPTVTVRWGLGEPSSFGDCGALNSTGLLGALVCNQLEPFICEVSPTE
jgi:hypothetical protein